MVKRVRGVAHSMRVSPQVSNRMVDGARGPLNSLLADVFIFTDHMSGPSAGNSPGFGITLVAETTSGGLIGSEAQAEVHKEVILIPFMHRMRVVHSPTPGKRTYSWTHPPLAQGIRDLFPDFVQNFAHPYFSYFGSFLGRKSFEFQGTEHDQMYL